MIPNDKYLNKQP